MAKFKPPKLLSVAKCAKMVGVDKRTLMSHLKRTGGLQRVGGQWRTTAEHLAAAFPVAWAGLVVQSGVKPGAGAEVTAAELGAARHRLATAEREVAKLRAELEEERKPRGGGVFY